jgi:hypothetical protein
MDETVRIKKLLKGSLSPFAPGDATDASWLILPSQPLGGGNPTELYITFGCWADETIADGVVVDGIG